MSNPHLNSPRLSRLAICAGVLTTGWMAQLAPAVAATRTPPSPYPAGAQRPERTVRASEFAHKATAGGTSPATVGHGRTTPGRIKSATGKATKHPPRKPRPPVNVERAQLAFKAMQKAYYVQGTGLYEGEPYSYLWPFSQALAATVSMANIPTLKSSFTHEVHARLIGLKAYLDVDNSGEPEGTFTSNLAAYDGTVAPPEGPGGEKYYDDNAWVGIELVRIYEQTHATSLLAAAEAIMAFEMAAWDTQPGIACPGGIPFSNSIANRERNTITDAPTAELGAQLYRLTGNALDLHFSELAYEWVRNCLTEPNGLYADHISPTGQVEPTEWSYNQGTMIGAGVLLYKATGDSVYLYEARQTAKAALSYYTPERLGQELPFFVSVYFRNMLYLDSVTRDPPGAKLVQGYVDYAWNSRRLSNDQFVAGSPASAQLLVQAAIVQDYALLSSSPTTYF